MIVSKKPVIGISCHFDSKENYYKVYSIFSEVLEKNGAIPIMLPMLDENNTKILLEKINGLLISDGAGEINRKVNQGEVDKIPSLREQNPKRYDFEKMLIENAFSLSIPIMGICRGYQMIGEVFGGSIDNIERTENHYQKKPENETLHSIKIESNSRFFETLGNDILNVNSFHRQHLSKVPDDFIVSSRSKDGIIESIEHKDKFVIGVQFHPENLIESNNNFNKIFRKFVEKSSNLTSPTD
ncbi:MAG: gamma-glutamyl-gamma-aminobutyrate hydrolase family protein [Nanoarchaeota archaeon]